MTGVASIEKVTSWVKEASGSAGVTPSNPAWKRSSFTTINFTSSPRITEQGSASHGGQRFSLSRSGTSISGSASGGLIYGNYDDLFESLFQSEWGEKVAKGTGNGYRLSADAASGSTSVSIDGGGASQGAAANQVANRGTILQGDVVRFDDDAFDYVVTSVTKINEGAANEIITTIGVYPALQQAFSDNDTLTVQENTSRLKNGTDQIAFSFEDRIPHEPGGSVYNYLRYKGVEAQSGTLEITAGGQTNLSMEFVGSGDDDAGSAILENSTYADPFETDIIGSGSDIGEIRMAGFTLDCLRSVSVSFANEGKDEQPQVGSDDLCGISRGAMLPVITGEFYVEGNMAEVYNAARAATTAFEMRLGMGSVSGAKYSLVFPSCEFVEAPLVTSDTGPAFQNFRILPKYDAANEATAMLDRRVI